MAATCGRFRHAAQVSRRERIMAESWLFGGKEGQGREKTGTLGICKPLERLAGRGFKESPRIAARPVLHEGSSSFDMPSSIDF